MKIYKPINNNIVSAFDDSGREVVIIGKGIGYKAREGTEIPPQCIDKIFIMSSQNNMERLKALFESLPAEYVEITGDILEHAKRYLDKRLNEAAYFTLADHIGFAITRYKQGMEFQNVLLTEVRRFYAKEYSVGLYALQLMKERLGVDMPEDEAASIALHILNAEYDISFGDAFHATKLMDKIVDLLTRETGCVIDANNLCSDRLLTHLKYLTQRLIRNEPLPADEDNILYNTLLEQYPEEILCAEKVAAMVMDEHKFMMSKEEICSLAIHIKRIRQQAV